MRTRQRLVIVLTVLNLFVFIFNPFLNSAPVEAGGPLLVNKEGVPYRWDTSQPVPYTVDQGTLGLLSNTQAINLTNRLFEVWTDVLTASIELQPQGQLSTDVTGANVIEFMNNLPEGVNPIIFDTDGGIVDALLGAGAKSLVAGIAGPERVEDRHIRQAFSILNGLFIDGRDDGITNPEVPLPIFRTTFIHEFGHFIGLDHSALNTPEAFDTNEANDAAIPTMFPLIVSVEQSSLHLDDVAAVSTLYPTPEFTATTGVIRGRVLFPDGASFQGANVVARMLEDPLVTAISSVSGFLHTGSRWGGEFGSEDPQLLGLYEISGLPPGAYTVEVATINGQFRGGSGVGPVDTPLALSKSQFFTGPGQIASSDRTQAAPVAVSAGSVVDAIDIMLNGRILSVADVQGPPGETVSVSVGLSDGRLVSGFLFTVSFDSRVLSLNEALPVAPGTLVPTGFLVFALRLNQNQALVVISPPFSNPTATLRPGQGTLVRLSFQVAAAAQSGATSPLGVSDIMGIGSGASRIDFLGQGGTFTVGPRP